MACCRIGASIVLCVGWSSEFSYKREGSFPRDANKGKTFSKEFLILAIVIRQFI